MKKRIVILSLLLTLALTVNTVIPVLSGTITDVFRVQPQSAALREAVGDDADAADSTASDPKEAAYADGNILIYNFDQLSMIGSGKSYQYDDGSSAVYAADAAYRLMQEIPVPRGAVWQLPDGFKGTVTGDKQAYAPLYDNTSDSVYLYNPYQLATMGMENADSQPVLSGDTDAKSFGSGQPLTVGDDGKTLLTYSHAHNYIVSSQFSSEVSEKPVSVLTAKESVEAVGAQADNSVGVAPYDGRDFAGQVLKTIGTTTYILIGNDAQLRAIGSGVEVYSAVYQTVYHAWHGHQIDTDNEGNPILLYGGDADLEEEQNGRKDFAFQQIDDVIKPSALDVRFYTGVNPETGQPYLEDTRVTEFKEPLINSSVQIAPSDFSSGCTNKSR